MASPTRRKKRCLFCNELFLPDPRLKSRQIACSRTECQKARNQANQSEWKKRHPDCFKGRYPNTKRWLAKHPGYLARYRGERPEKVQRDNQRRLETRKLSQEICADIQNSILRQRAISFIQVGGRAPRPASPLGWRTTVLVQAIERHRRSRDGLLEQAAGGRAFPGSGKSVD